MKNDGKVHKGITRRGVKYTACQPKSASDLDVARTNRWQFVTCDKCVRTAGHESVDAMLRFIAPRGDT